MDQLWRELKRLTAANRQADTIDALADDAAEWLLTLTRQQARRKAGMTSKRFWLKNLLQVLADEPAATLLAAYLAGC
jgi:hypothetical protein